MTMRIEAKVVDGSKITVGLRIWPSEMTKSVLKQLVKSANQVRNEMIKSMRDTPKTGRAYKRGSKVHIASSPGNPPAIDTVELLRSIVVDVKSEGIEVGALIGAPYAPFLEEGTSRMEPRPFLIPALDKLTPQINNDLLKAISESTKNVFGS